jgi:capsid protein
VNNGTFNGSSDHPLLTDWLTYFRGQETTWASEWRMLAGRALALVCNDPFIAALVAAAIQGTLGPTGLRHSSLFDDTPNEPGTSDSSRAIRRNITALCTASWYGRDLDAEGIRTRGEIEWQLAWMAWVLGDGFAVRVWRKGRSVWRIVTPDRVKNPDGRGNDDKIRDGFQLDSDGKVIGIYVDTGSVGTYGIWMPGGKPQYFPWFAADGTPNVIHRVGFRIPGMLRGVTRLAPMIIMSRQLGGVLESHVASKRMQAIYGMIVEAEDTEAYKAAQATGDTLDPYNFAVKGPLNLWVKPPGSTVQFTDTKFNGADLDAYLNIMYRVQCAAVQMPVDVVLCQMGDASLSSARAGLDQFDRTCQSEQERHLAECTTIMDRVEVAGAILRGELSLPTDNWQQIMAGKYQRPPKYSTDRLKDANTITALIAAGFSRTTAFEIVGASFEDESELRAAEAQFDAAQGHGGSPAPAASTDPAKTPAAPASGQGQAPTPTEQAGDMPSPEDQTKPDKPAASAPWWKRILSHRRHMRDAA